MKWGEKKKWKNAALDSAENAKSKQHHYVKEDMSVIRRKLLRYIILNWILDFIHIFNSKYEILVYDFRFLQLMILCKF